MHQEVRGLFAAGSLALLGTALLFHPELRQAGLLAIGGSLVFAAMCVWFLRRGGNVPHPVDEIEKPTLTSREDGCPSCGSMESRPMTAVETTQFYGYDRLVVVRPVCCIACGVGYEPPTPLWGRRLLLGLLIVGMACGAALAASGPFVSWKAVHDAALDEFRRTKLVLSGCVMVGIGVWWIRRCTKIARRLCG